MLSFICGHYTQFQSKLPNTLVFSQFKNVNKLWARKLGLVLGTLTYHIVSKSKKFNADFFQDKNLKKLERI